MWWLKLLIALWLSEIPLMLLWFAIFRINEHISSKPAILQTLENTP